MLFDGFHINNGPILTRNWYARALLEICNQWDYIAPPPPKKKKKSYLNHYVAFEKLAHLLAACGGDSNYNAPLIVHGAKMEPIWGRQDPGGPHVGPMNFAIWGAWHTRGEHTTGVGSPYWAM